MSKPLKYKSLIESHNLTIDCPGDGFSGFDCEAFRWFREDWTVEENLLPNYLEPGPPRQVTQEHKKCGMCALSFYDNLETAVKNYSKFSPQQRSLMRKTHVYKGNLYEIDGLRSPIHRGHFNFYEFEEVDLTPRFSEVRKFEPL